MRRVVLLRRAGRFGRVAVFLPVASLALAAQPAAADTTIAKVTRPTPLSFYAGRLVWSEFDGATGRYRLMARSEGRTTVLPVATRAVPFDVDLGPDRSGAAVAVYSRCRREPRTADPPVSNAVALQLPNWRTGRGCDLFRFGFGDGRERKLRRPSSRASSEFLPTIWHDRLAFARVYERRRGRRGQTAYIYAARLSSGRLRRLPAGPRSRLRWIGPGNPSPGRLIVEPGPTALDLVGGRLAFVWDWAAPDGAVSDVRLDGVGGSHRLVERAGSGEIQASELLSPAIVAGDVYYASSNYGNDTFTRYRRYRIATGALEEAPASADQPFLALATATGSFFSLQPAGFQPGCTLQPEEPGQPDCWIVDETAPPFVPVARTP